MLWLDVVLVNQLSQLVFDKSWELGMGNWELDKVGTVNSCFLIPSSIF